MYKFIILTLSICFGLNETGFRVAPAVPVIGDVKQDVTTASFDVVINSKTVINQQKQIDIHNYDSLIINEGAEVHLTNDNNIQNAKAIFNISKSAIIHGTITADANLHVELLSQDLIFDGANINAHNFTAIANTIAIKQTNLNSSNLNLGSFDATKTLCFDKASNITATDLHANINLLAKHTIATGNIKAPIGTVEVSGSEFVYIEGIKVNTGYEGKFGVFIIDPGFIYLPNHVGTEPNVNIFNTGGLIPSELSIHQISSNLSTSHVVIKASNKISLYSPIHIWSHNQLTLDAPHIYIDNFGKITGGTVKLTNTFTQEKARVTIRAPKSLGSKLVTFENAYTNEPITLDNSTIELALRNSSIKLKGQNAIKKITNEAAYISLSGDPSLFLGLDTYIIIGNKMCKPDPFVYHTKELIIQECGNQEDPLCINAKANVIRLIDAWVVGEKNSEDGSYLTAEDIFLSRASGLTGDYLATKSISSIGNSFTSLKQDNFLPDTVIDLQDNMALYGNVTLDKFKIRHGNISLNGYTLNFSQTAKAGFEMPIKACKFVDSIDKIGTVSFTDASNHIISGNMENAHILIQDTTMVGFETFFYDKKSNAYTSIAQNEITCHSFFANFAPANLKIFATADLGEPSVILVYVSDPVYIEANYIKFIGAYSSDTKIKDDANLELLDAGFVEKIKFDIGTLILSGETIVQSDSFGDILEVNQGASIGGQATFGFKKVKFLGGTIVDGSKLTFQHYNYEQNKELATTIYTEQLEPTDAYITIKNGILTAPICMSTIEVYDNLDSDFEIIVYDLVLHNAHIKLDQALIHEHLHLIGFAKEYTGLAEIYIPKITLQASVMAPINPDTKEVILNQVFSETPIALKLRDPSSILKITNCEFTDYAGLYAHTIELDATKMFTNAPNTNILILNNMRSDVRDTLYLPSQVSLSILDSDIKLGSDLTIDAGADYSEFYMYNSSLDLSGYTLTLTKNTVFTCIDSVIYGGTLKLYGTQLSYIPKDFEYTKETALNLHLIDDAMITDFTNTEFTSIIVDNAHPLYGSFDKILLKNVGSSALTYDLTGDLVGNSITIEDSFLAKGSITSISQIATTKGNVQSPMVCPSCDDIAKKPSSKQVIYSAPGTGGTVTTIPEDVVYTSQEIVDSSILAKPVAGPSFSVSGEASHIKSEHQTAIKPVLEAVSPMKAPMQEHSQPSYAQSTQILVHQEGKDSKEQDIVSLHSYQSIDSTEDVSFTDAISSPKNHDLTAATTQEPTETADFKTTLSTTADISHTQVLTKASSTDTSTKPATVTPVQSSSLPAGSTLEPSGFSADKAPVQEIPKAEKLTQDDAKAVSLFDAQSVDSSESLSSADTMFALSSTEDISHTLVLLKEPNTDTSASPAIVTSVADSTLKPSGPSIVKAPEQDVTRAKSLTQVDIKTVSSFDSQSADRSESLSFSETIPAPVNLDLTAAKTREPTETTDAKTTVSPTADISHSLVLTKAPTTDTSTKPPIVTPVQSSSLPSDITFEPSGFSADKTSVQEVPRAANLAQDDAKAMSSLDAQSVDSSKISTSDVHTVQSNPRVTPVITYKSTSNLLTDTSSKHTKQDTHPVKGLVLESADLPVSSNVQVVHQNIKIASVMHNTALSATAADAKTADISHSLVLTKAPSTDTSSKHTKQGTHPVKGLVLESADLPVSSNVQVVHQNIKIASVMHNTALSATAADAKTTLSPTDDISHTQVLTKAPTTDTITKPVSVTPVQSSYLPSGSTLKPSGSSVDKAPVQEVPRAKSLTQVDTKAASSFDAQSAYSNEITLKPKSSILTLHQSDFISAPNANHKEAIIDTSEAKARSSYTDISITDAKHSDVATIKSYDANAPIAQDKKSSVQKPSFDNAKNPVEVKIEDDFFSKEDKNASIDLAKEKAIDLQIPTKIDNVTNEDSIVQKGSTITLSDGDISALKAPLSKAFEKKDSFSLTTSVKQTDSKMPLKASNTDISSLGLADFASKQALFSRKNSKAPQKKLNQSKAGITQPAGLKRLSLSSIAYGKANGKLYLHEPEYQHKTDKAQLFMSKTQLAKDIASHAYKTATETIVKLQSQEEQEYTVSYTKKSDAHVDKLLGLYSKNIHDKKAKDYAMDFIDDEDEKISTVEWQDKDQDLHKGSKEYKLHLKIIQGNQLSLVAIPDGTLRLTKEEDELDNMLDLTDSTNLSAFCDLSAKVRI